MDILVTVEGQKMKIATNQRRYTEGSKQFVQFRFDLSEEWHDMIIFANFVQGDKLYPVRLNDSACAHLPSKVKEGNCLLVLYGGTSGKQTSENDAGSVIKATTEPLFLDIGKDVTAQKVPELVTDTDQSNYERMLKELKEGILANKVFNDAITDAVNSLNDSAVAQEIIENKNVVTTMRNELLGDGGTNSNPGNDSTLDRINKSYNEIIGLGKTYNFPADNSALKEIRNAKEQIVGKDNTDTAGSPDETSALGQINKMYDEIIGENGDYTDPIDNTALSEIRSAKTEILGANTNNNAASPADTSALGQINKAYDEIIGKTGSSEYPEANSALDEIRKARNTIVGEDGKSGALANVIQFEAQAGTSKIAAETAQEAVAADKASVEADKASVESAKNSVDSSKASVDEAKQEIFGNGDTTSPSVGSALREIRDTRAEVAEFNKTGGSLEQAKAAAQTAIDKANAATVSENNAKESETKAAASAAAAAESAKSANQGIMVVDNLNTVTDPTNTALSANQGKVLNDAKLDISGGVMTGALTLSGAPEEDLHAATKKYVDDHTPPVVTTEKDGLMLATDKTKLDGIAENANNYTLPEATADRLGGVKIDDAAVEGSTKAITSKAVYERLAGLKFVISTEEPTNADDNILTIVIPG